jgi:hypothetical protein
VYCCTSCKGVCIVAQVVKFCSGSHQTEIVTIKAAVSLEARADIYSTVKKIEPFE